MCYASQSCTRPWWSARTLGGRSGCERHSSISAFMLAEPSSAQAARLESQDMDSSSTTCAVALAGGRCQGRRRCSRCLGPPPSAVHRRQCCQRQLLMWGHLPLGLQACRRRCRLLPRHRSRDLRQLQFQGRRRWRRRSRRTPGRCRPAPLRRWRRRRSQLHRGRPTTPQQQTRHNRVRRGELLQEHDEAGSSCQGSTKTFQMRPCLRGSLTLTVLCDRQTIAQRVQKWSEALSGKPQAPRVAHPVACTPAAASAASSRRSAAASERLDAAKSNSCSAKRAACSNTYGAAAF